MHHALLIHEVLLNAFTFISVIVMLYINRVLKKKKKRIEIKIKTRHMNVLCLLFSVVSLAEFYQYVTFYFIHLLSLHKKRQL